jgi:hypothetical protein
MQHDPDRSAFPGDTPGFKDREKKILLFSVVAGVREKPYELNAFGETPLRKLAGLFEPLDEPLENPNHAKNHLMLCAKDRHRIFRLLAIHFIPSAGDSAP